MTSPITKAFAVHRFFVYTPQLRASLLQSRKARSTISSSKAPEELPLWVLRQRVRHHAVFRAETPLTNFMLPDEPWIHRPL